MRAQSPRALVNKGGKIMGHVIGRDGKPVRNSDANDPANQAAAGDESGEDDRGNRSVDTRFQKGNKHGKGRPKGSLNMRTIVKQVADGKLSAKSNGKIRKRPRRELAVEQVGNKAAAGDLRAFDRFNALQERYYPQEDAADPSLKALKPDIDTLRNYLAWHDLLDPPASDDGDCEESGND